MNTPPAITVDSKKFDALQIRLLDEIAREVKSALAAAGVASDEIQDAAENLTFGIAAIIDGGRVMDLEGVPVRPVVTFAQDDTASQLVAAGSASWMHEYAIGAVEQLFDQDENA